MLTELSLKAYLGKTASAEPVPGGGSASALSGALAAALAGMVANLTAGKKGYERWHADMETVAVKADELMRDLMAAVDADAAAFDGVMAAFRMPKASDTQRAARAAAIQDAFKTATRTPLSVAEKALAVMELADTAVKHGNKNALSDGAVGAMLAGAAVRGANYNVNINLGSREDRAFVTSVSEKIKAIAARARQLEADILENVDL